MRHIAGFQLTEEMLWSELTLESQTQVCTLLLLLLQLLGQLNDPTGLQLYRRLRHH